MSQTPQPIYLSIERAMEFIGDANGVLSLLKTLEQTLSDDLPRLQDLLSKGDVYGGVRISSVGRPVTNERLGFTGYDKYRK